MEYDFKNIHKTFDISYFSKDKDLFSGNLVDPNELKKYESIEKLTSDLAVILIRKFKLRLSFRKNSKFSQEIVFCDDYDFDPSVLKHDDSIIKIAIVKENLDKWIYLESYDYIFTFKENVKELKGFKNVLPIEDKPVFNQIKYILNVLYERKSNKYYYFLKNITFGNVFPKTPDYFKVLNSEFFDDQWYHETYELENNTDSVIHFLLIGYAKGNDPGPDFSTNEYYECNSDVEAKGINPLVHYELYGRKENRIKSLSERDDRDYDLVLNSEYFDEEWYRSHYGLSDDVDAVKHYLHEGYIKRFNPGPNFSTQEYFECNVDVKRILANPLVHYELSGRKKNRRIQLTDEQHQANYDFVSNSPYFDKEWYESHYDFGDDMDAASHYLKIGYTRGFDPGPDFSTNEYFECNGDVKEHGMNPLLHYERHGRKEKRVISISERDERDYDLVLNSEYFDEEWYRSHYDLSDDVDAANHYLHEGYIKRYNPGPNFSTYEYYECNYDVKKIRLNPLVHYELTGRKENRRIGLTPKQHKADYDLISNSEYFDEEWYKSHYDFGDDMDVASHYLKIGYTRGFDPGPDFSTNEYFECNGDVKEHGMNPLLHYERHGRNEKREISLKT